MNGFQQASGRTRGGTKHVAWAEELISLVSILPTGWQVETERCMGTLLSYSQQETDAWIRWIGLRKG
jgi:hypothetical protein